MYIMPIPSSYCVIGQTSRHSVAAKPCGISHGHSIVGGLGRSSSRTCTTHLPLSCQFQLSVLQAKPQLEHLLHLSPSFIQTVVCASCEHNIQVFSTGSLIEMRFSEPMPQWPM